VDVAAFKVSGMSRKGMAHQDPDLQAASLALLLCRAPMKCHLMSVGSYSKRYA
jgi:hypothetical protein